MNSITNGLLINFTTKPRSHVISSTLHTTFHDGILFNFVALEFHRYKTSQVCSLDARFGGEIDQQTVPCIRPIETHSVRE